MLSEEEFKKYLRWLMYTTTVYHAYNTIRQHDVNDIDKTLAIITDVLRIFN